MITLADAIAEREAANEGCWRPVIGDDPLPALVHGKGYRVKAVLQRTAVLIDPELPALSGTETVLFYLADVLVLERPLAWVKVPDYGEVHALMDPGAGSKSRYNGEECDREGCHNRLTKWSQSPTCPPCKRICPDCGGRKSPKAEKCRDCSGGVHHPCSIHDRLVATA
jgi:hypothetical protein